MSCLFDSLAQITSYSGGASRLRRHICDYLATDPVLFDDGNVRLSRSLRWSGEAPSLEAYIEKMRREDTWGGATEIKAFCDMFRCDVSVLDQRTRRVMTFECRGSPRWLVGLEWTGDHFEPGEAR